MILILHKVLLCKNVIHDYALMQWTDDPVVSHDTPINLDYLKPGIYTHHDILWWKNENYVANSAISFCFLCFLQSISSVFKMADSHSMKPCDYFQLPKRKYGKSQGTTYTFMMKGLRYTEIRFGSRAHLHMKSGPCSPLGICNALCISACIASFYRHFQSFRGPRLAS